MKKVSADEAGKDGAFARTWGHPRWRPHTRGRM